MLSGMLQKQSWSRVVLETRIILRGALLVVEKRKFVRLDNIQRISKIFKVLTSALGISGRSQTRPPKSLLDNSPENPTNETHAFEGSSYSLSTKQSQWTGSFLRRSKPMRPCRPTQRPFEALTRASPNLCLVHDNRLVGPYHISDPWQRNYRSIVTLMRQTQNLQRFSDVPCARLYNICFILFL